MALKVMLKMGEDGRGIKESIHIHLNQQLNGTEGTAPGPETMQLFEVMPTEEISRVSG
jgi:hypothetical protein